jgi:hypothetical protein
MPSGMPVTGPQPIASTNTKPIKEYAILGPKKIEKDGYGRNGRDRRPNFANPIKASSDKAKAGGCEFHKTFRHLPHTYICLLTIVPASRLSKYASRIFKKSK